ncbi:MULTISPECIES: phosphatidate cytidylyltransferase [Cobetia]|uniref:Phosphatidate cytidylyltransferase n=1 Tax=Cobetia crustatorum TaxID=553385 RepID=A0A558HH09_9GAMM|nr:MULTISPECIES: phosphatidate cytidylyltransferase [Cobetia]TVU68348.1 phosphatidate cytidylyltransferase [Cobetia crustatorum]
MLRQRIITAVILAPLALLGLFGLDGAPFAVFTGGIVALGAWEWANLSGVSAGKARLLFPLTLVVLMLLAGMSDGLEARWPLYLAAMAWAINLRWVMRYPAASQEWRAIGVRLGVGALALLPTWFGLIQLKAGGAEWLLYVLLMVWAADIGAYFSGKRFGKRKLAPRVSPGKSWEGVYGGLVATGLLATGYALAGQADWLPLLVVTLGVTAVSVLGDLLESMFKRERKLKDSSQLLPGHGGIMDRIDSLTAAVPMFALLLPWILGGGA